NAGGDVILGGAGGDTIHGDAANPGASDAADVIIGDQGQVLYTAAGLLQTVQSTDTAAADGGEDAIHGNDGNDLILGGVDVDSVWGDAGNDIVIGDDGVMTVGTAGPALGVVVSLQNSNRTL